MDTERPFIECVEPDQRGESSWERCFGSIRRWRSSSAVTGRGLAGVRSCFGRSSCCPWSSFAIKVPKGIREGMDKVTVADSQGSRGEAGLFVRATN